MRRKTLASIILIVLIGTIIGAAYGLLTYQKTISSAGKLHKIGIQTYKDQACTQQLDIIDWGTVQNGEAYTYSFYIKNIQTVPVTLTMTTGNYQPPQSQQALILSWNVDQQTVLSPTDILHAIITLSVNSNDQQITQFSHDIVITATEHI